MEGSPIGLAALVLIALAVLALLAPELPYFVDLVRERRQNEHQQGAHREQRR